MPVVDPVFQREKHVYRNDDFEEILKDAVRFFNGTPVHALPPPERFAGSGVYAIYCISNSGIYQKFGTQVNRLDYAVPIYVGKAVPQGWRQGRNIDGTDDGTSLFSRLQTHAKSMVLAIMIQAKNAFPACCQAGTLFILDGHGPNE